MRAKYVGTPDDHTDPELYWDYKYLDLSGNEKVSCPLPRSEIEFFYTNGLLTEDILVRPFVEWPELYHAPYVTIGKMVACGWAYPGPA